MSVAKLKKPKASRVVGIDCSTKSFAYSVFEDDKFIKAGEVIFEGSDIYERLADARRKIQPLVDDGTLAGDYVAIEGAAVINSRTTVIHLSYFYGLALGVVLQKAKNIEIVSALTWQASIGVPNLKQKEKDEIKAMYPGKSASWYKAKGREIRKQKIADWASQFTDVSGFTDNITDAIGVGWWTSEKLTRR